MYTITVDERIRDDLLRFLRSRGVGASVHFDPPIHKQPPYSSAKKDSKLENTELLARSIITLPLYSGIQTADIDRVCDTILSYPELVTN